MTNPKQLKVPNNIINSLQRYAQDKTPTGDFLRAVLSNDLMEAVGRADDRNIFLIPAIAIYIFNTLTINCYGSSQIVDDWLKKD